MTKEEFIDKITKIKDIELLKNYLIENDIHIDYNNNNNLKQNKQYIIKKFIKLFGIKPKIKEIPKKYLYVGDSLIKIFSHQKKFNETILSYPGFKCVNLLDNNIFNDINNIVFSHLVLCFGSNDLLLDYFYFYNNDSNYTITFIKKITDVYIQFINLLHSKDTIVNIKIIIPFYSPIDDKYFYQSLVKYNKQNIKFQKNDHIYSQTYRNNLIDVFQSYLTNSCSKLHKINIININNKISNNGIINNEYKLTNPFDMHLKWLPLLTHFN